METKVCSKCKEELPATTEYFRKAVYGRLKLASSCKICDQIYYLRNCEEIKRKVREYTEANKDRINEARRVENLSEEQLEKERACSKRSYLRNKEKRAKNAKIYRDAKAGYIKAKVLNRKFGITEEELQQKLNEQKGCCEICRESLIAPESDRSYAVDHNHTTGEVRGLLCANCNRSLGLLKENKATLISMIDYLTKYNE